MTEPLNKIEIEDVLSSIRRLVSDEPRVAKAGGLRPSAAPRLVLTPALRVWPDAKPAAEPRAADPAPEGLAPAEAPQPLRAKEPPVLLHIVEDDLPEPELVLFPGPASATAGNSDLARKLADIEALLNARDVPFEPDLEEAPLSPSDAPWLARHAEEAMVEEAPFIADAEESDPLPDPQGFGWTEPAAAAASPGEGFADLEDEILRRLVRDVLREELQGPTGERVTRNLRKMVRAEIGRALTARGLT